ncbi:MAG: GTPase ObgE [Alphaproteobacteria bacterium]|nr:GTPase ObgE [Alphaproteobacteria bacterium]
MRFIDEIEIFVASGKGGDGCMSFRREAHVPRGGPDGGDGGRGGDLVLRASTRRNTLVDLRRNKRYAAKNGQPGGTKNMTGARGEELVIEVPLGTVVVDADTDDLLADLATDGAEWRLQGGDGGLGNPHFKSSTHRTPRVATPGQPGEERQLRLELKLLADVGLLGFPNAGKSTLISTISQARPRVADYPFTTLVPNLGVVRVDWETSFVVADIPGLIEGASEGAGLGHQFLRHVERCPVYVHLVAADAEEGPEARYQTLVDELAAYAEELVERTQIVVLSKTDLLDDPEATAAELAEAIGHPVIPISAPLRVGVDRLVKTIASTLARVREDANDLAGD